ncbi:MAG: hypothetical protein V3V95_09230 [Thermodesulfobacteriota bacterium]
MEKYFIEVPHEADPGECARAIQLFFETGSHYMTRADWGCKDGVHKAFIIVDAESREEAKGLIPRVFHSEAKVVKLNKFTKDEVDALLRLEHSA